MKSNPSIQSQDHCLMSSIASLSRYLQDGFEDGEDEELLALKTDDSPDEDVDSSIITNMRIEGKRFVSLKADGTKMALTDFCEES